MILKEFSMSVEDYGKFLKDSDHLFKEWQIWKLESDVESIELYGEFFLRNQIHFTVWLEMQKAPSDQLKVRHFGDIHDETPLITEDYTFADYELVN
jgi:hypothetical protein